LSRDYTWDLKTADEGKHSKLRLIDNYLRFYLKYVQPNRRRIERGTLSRLPNIDGILGLQFENIVLKNRLAIFERLHIDPNDVCTTTLFSAKNTAPRRMPDRLSDPDPAEDALCMRIKFSKNVVPLTGWIYSRPFCHFFFFRRAGENRAAQYAATHELSTGVDPCGRHCRKYPRTRVFCVS